MMTIYEMLSENVRLRLDLEALDRDRLNMSEELVRLSEENAELRTELEDIKERVKHELGIWDYASHARILAIVEGRGDEGDEGNV